MTITTSLTLISRYQRHLKRIFILIDLALIILAVSIISLYLAGEFNPVTLNLIALWSGKTALIFYLLTIIPGITRRFGLTSKIIIPLTLFRRQFGVLMYLLTLTHYSLMRGILLLQGIKPFPLPWFEVAGFLAFVLLTPMFLTSNDQSVRKLGKNWKKIHSLTYLIIWLIFLHLALQRLSLWSILAFTGLFLQILSFLYTRRSHS